MTPTRRRGTSKSGNGALWERAAACGEYCADSPGTVADGGVAILADDGIVAKPMGNAGCRCSDSIGGGAGNNGPGKLGSADWLDWMASVDSGEGVVPGSNSRVPIEAPLVVPCVGV